MMHKAIVVMSLEALDYRPVVTLLCADTHNIYMATVYVQ